MQKGFSPVLLVIFLSVAVFAGVFLISPAFKQNNSQSPAISIPNPVKSLKKEPSIYSSKDLGFEFSYEGDDLVAKEDTEEAFNKRSNGDFRKNFRGYVTYDPGKFLGGVVIPGKDGSYETNPFTLWVFDNPQDLSIDSWFDKYWYYPFLWGVFDYVSKGHVALDQEATISGQMAKSKIVSYQPGLPKYVYLSKEKKMYLFRIIGEEGNKILSTFKFINN